MRKSFSCVMGLLVAVGCGSTPDDKGPGGPLPQMGGDPGPMPDPASNPGMPGMPGQPGKVASPTHLISGLSVDEVAVFQAVKVSVVKAGAKTSHSVPIVANRTALVRVYVKPGSSWSSKAVTAALRLTAPNGTAFPTLQSTKTIAGPSTDAAPDTTFNFDVPGSSLPVGVKYAVALTDAAAPETKDGTVSPARYPADGSLEGLGAANSGAQLRVTLVPVQYQADGSNRLPDISASQVERYRQQMFAIYPTAKVEITVRAPFPWASSINPNGSGFGRILQAMVDLRSQDNAPDDVYYFGAFAPASSFNNFCAGSCVTGLSGVLDQPNDPSGRASVGTGFGGDPSSAQTMAHEVGHAHGRNHAPCGGASGVDPAFPYKNGSIGVWGYNVVSKELINPVDGRDLMGYCQPEWVSDYTFSALFDRVQFVNHAAQVRGARFAAPVNYRFVDVAEDGSLSFGQSVTLRAQPAAEAHPVTYTAPDGSTVATGTGHFYKYDHLPGGFMMVPEGPATYSSLTVHGLAAKPASQARRTY